MAKQEDFLIEANKWSNIFLTWIWGSWKSYILQEWVKQNSKKKIVTVWPTWVSAINVWWSTIHSAFKIYWNDYRFIKSQLIQWSEVDVLIIDEISMVSCDLFDYINKILKRECKDTKPFWWLQIIVVWDLAQIPPIFWPDVRERYNELITKHWSVLFNVSKSYKDWKFLEINLTENKRSVDDKLNNILNKIREWDLSSINELQKLNSEVDKTKYVHIVPTNVLVDNINNVELEKIDWKKYLFKWRIKWQFNLNNVLTPDELILKIWARVMITKNFEWMYNWDLWTILQIRKDWIVIMSDRLWLEILVQSVKWKNIIYDEHGNEEELWSFTQIPLKLAYALTAHKCQWLTLNKIIVYVNSRMSKEMLYVAFSRATDYNWIYVVNQ
jgi:ATP-dependent exoDNAse (exonuclease V) alpha subunit